jgi:hemerythrin-like domain-containing protein
MKSSRRHDSIVPLSREHHYGLMVCLRIHRGLPINKSDNGWLERERKKTVRFFESDLKQHFKAEEEVLFPSMQRFSGASSVIARLFSEHRRMEALIEQLGRASIETLADTLGEFADLLEEHIRMEERVLFPIYEKQASREIAEEVKKAIVELIGTAMQPKNAE